MSKIFFHSDYTVLSRTELLQPRTEMEIRDEPMLFRADPDLALDKGGPITREFLSKLPYRFRPVFLDVKVVMLMPGMYPCIPGWHLDDVPRTRADGQPDHENPDYKAEQIMALVGDCSLTSFAVGDIHLDDVLMYHGPVYGWWHQEIEQRLAMGSMREIAIPERHLVSFNWMSFHRGNKATKFGWRYFVRATRNTGLKPLNEIRNHVQVYLDDPKAGW